MNIFIPRQTESLFRLFTFDKKKLVKDIEKADLVVFAGGEDISPSIYGGIRSPLTESPNTLRDMEEVEIFTRARKKGIPMVGICRGAQLLCALSGHKIFQDVNRHTVGHIVAFDDPISIEGHGKISKLLMAFA